MIDPIMPPIHPSIVLFGLILLNLCFPIYLPIKYANISVPQALKRINQTKIFPFSALLKIEINIIKNVIYAIPKKVIAISVTVIFKLVIILSKNNIIISNLRQFIKKVERFEII